MVVQERLVKVGVSTTNCYGALLGASCIANPEQPLASCFTTDLGEHIKKASLLVPHVVA